MFDDERPHLDPIGDFGRELDRRMNAGRSAIRSAAHSARNWTVGRVITSGEVREVQWMFGQIGLMSMARIFPRNYWWPYPNDRAMTPHGDIFFPGVDFYEDFSQPYVPLNSRALFMHEATHLYQWYVLGIPVVLVGPFDRNYKYDLVPGKPFQAYGLEQMGQIVQDYCTLRNGGIVRGLPYKAQDYDAILPLRSH